MSCKLISSLENIGEGGLNWPTALMEKTTVIKAPLSAGCNPTFTTKANYRRNLALYDSKSRFICTVNVP